MKMKKTSLNTSKATDRKIKRLYLVAATVVAAAFVMAMQSIKSAMQWGNTDGSI